MQIARVVGTVVSTRKNRKLEGAKLLLVQPMTPDGQPRGTTLLTIDSVGAGVGETARSSKGRRRATRRRKAAVDAASLESSTRSIGGSLTDQNLRAGDRTDETSCQVARLGAGQSDAAPRRATDDRCAGPACRRGDTTRRMHGQNRMSA